MTDKEGTSVQFRITQPSFYAEDVLISNRIKVSKDRTVSGVIRLQFVDMTTKTVISDVTLDIVTGKALAEIIVSKIAEIEGVMKSKEPEKDVKKISRQQMSVKASETEDSLYTG